MKLYRMLSLLVICSLVLLPSAIASLPVGGHKTGRQPHYVSNEILVKFRDGSRRVGLEKYRVSKNIGLIRHFKSIGVDHLRLPERMSVDEALVFFIADPDVLYAEPNYYRYTSDIPSGELFGQLWGLHNTGQMIDTVEGTYDADIDAPEAWDMNTGSHDVVVAVIDSGLDFSHPDLASNIWGNPGEISGNGVDDDANGFVDDIRGWDFINEDNAPLVNDASGHGTHVTGTIAADGGETTGMVGVSRQVQIMSLRTFDAYGTGDTTTAIRAFEYANAMGVDIINCSWGGAGYSQALKDAIAASFALVVCAAGNSGSNNDSIPHYPAAYDTPNILSVAATDPNDLLTIFSNYGTVSVDLAAPGANILSCTPGRRTLWRDNFDDGQLDGWNSGGPNNDWGLTNLESLSSPYSLADSPEGDYSQRTNSWVRSPVLNLAGVRNARLEFSVKGRSEPGYDTLSVEVSTDGSVWFSKPVKLSGIGIVAGISGTIAGWTEALVDLSNYDGLSVLYVRFCFLTDWTNNFDGWYIDDVTITAASSSYDGGEYKVLNGTSMAAPHVSGAAVLLKANHPELSAVEIKSILLETADIKPGLENVLASGGRLNAFKGIRALSIGVLQFGAAAYEIHEYNSRVTVTVIRTGGSSGVVTTEYDVSGGTALELSDYTEVGGSLFWADGEACPKTFTIGIIDDTASEDRETVEIVLTSVTGGAVIGSPAKAVLSIIDDDCPTCPSDFSFWLMILPAILNAK